MKHLGRSLGRVVPLVALALSGAALTAQTAPRRAATPASLLTYPGFYQGQLVVVRGTLVTRDVAVLTSQSVDRAIPLIFRGTSPADGPVEDRKSTRLNSSHLGISYAVFCF